MASIYKKSVVSIDPNTGSQTKSKSKKWWGRYRGSNGQERRVPLASDKTAAQAMLNELVRRSEREVAGIIDPFEGHRKRPLCKHLQDFKTYLENKGSTRNYIQTTHQRATSIVESIGSKTIGDITPSRVLDVLAAMRKQGISISSSNHYLRAIKMFTRWLVRDRRTDSDRLAHLSTLNEEVDRRRVRRPLTMEELTVLVAKSPFHKQPRRRTSGADRALLYIVAVYTGLRRGELASITPMSFDFESEPPTVTVEASYSKRRQQDVLPLRTDLAERLKAWLAQIPKLEASSLLFPIKNVRTSKMLKQDLEYVQTLDRRG